MRTKKRNRDGKWLRNPNQRRTPKVFEARFIQNADGSFEMLGGHTKVYTKKNQYLMEANNVDTRDFATELRRNKIMAR